MPDHSLIPRGMNVGRIPFMGARMEARTIYELPTMRYRSGKIAYLLKVRDTDGVPEVWFTVEDGFVTKHTRDSWGVNKEWGGWGMDKLE